VLEHSSVGPRQRPSAPVPLSHFGPQARKPALGVPGAIQRAPQIANDALSGGVGSVIVAGRIAMAGTPERKPRWVAVGAQSEMVNKAHRFPPPWTFASIGPALINEVFFTVSLPPWFRLNKQKFLRPRLIQSLRRFVCKSAAKLPAQES
jgi:hypothetical protein